MSWCGRGAKKNKKIKLDAQGFDPRTSRMQSGRATKCTMHPSLILLEQRHLLHAVPWNMICT
jgi:hypothetical protein